MPGKLVTSMKRNQTLDQYFEAECLQLYVAEEVCLCEQNGQIQDVCSLKYKMRPKYSANMPKITVKLFSNIASLLPFTVREFGKHMCTYAWCFLSQKYKFSPRVIGDVLWCVLCLKLGGGHGGKGSMSSVDLQFCQIICMYRTPVTYMYEFHYIMINCNLIMCSCSDGDIFAQLEFLLL